MPTLLPENATKFEVALSEAMQPAAVIASSIGSMRRIKYVSPRPSMLPFLVWEYGLGELTPYVPNIYNLLEEGVRWQRLRGTVSAVAIGIAWLGYTGSVEETWTGRRWWNSFQLRFPTLPVQDYPDLERIEGITALSVPKRSQLRRGVHLYDVGALEGDRSRLDNAMLDFSSGIPITPGGTIWSFGRSLSFEHTMTEAEGVSIGNWLPPIEGERLLWKGIHTLWVDAHFLWADSPELQRRAILAGWFAGKTLYLRLSDGSGNVIGYRRCRGVESVTPMPSGPFSMMGVRYGPSRVGSSAYIEALTQFDDADGDLCKEVAIIVGGTPIPSVKPGQQWLGPDQLTDGVAICPQPVAIPLRRTVRERFKFLLRF